MRSPKSENLFHGERSCSQKEKKDHFVVRFQCFQRPVAGLIPLFWHNACAVSLPQVSEIYI